MSKAVLRVGLWLLLPVSLVAQNNDAKLFAAHRGELYTGYSYVRMEGADMHGWNVAITGNVNPNLGIVGEFDGNYHSDTATVGTTTTNSTLNFHSAMGGFSVTERTTKYVTPFAHILVGMTRVNASVDVSRPGTPTSSVSNDVTGFSTALGGGIDLNLNDGFFWRLVQADYYLIRADGFKHEGARVSTGIVWRLGSKIQ